jgi:hypothetical protein
MTVLIINSQSYTHLVMTPQNKAGKTIIPVISCSHGEIRETRIIVAAIMAMESTCHSAGA